MNMGQCRSLLLNYSTPSGSITYSLIGRVEQILERQGAARNKDNSQGSNFDHLFRWKKPSYRLVSAVPAVCYKPLRKGTIQGELGLGWENST
jgi:hypothetical protein